jgi:hypothetical protein
LKKILWAVAFLWLGLAAQAQALKLLRGPYLQVGTPHSVIVKWRTDEASPSIVRYGRTRKLGSVAKESGRVKDHEVKLTGLKSYTSYFYSIASGAKELAGPAQGCRFTTYPAEGVTTTAHIWVLGDAGTKGCAQREVRDAYLRYSGDQRTDLVLQLGDNAYGAGEDSEYQQAMFQDMYEGLIRNTVFWSCLGNHETYGARPWAYWQIYSFPTRGEAGGVASGSSHYFSFDYSNIHFVDLDSMDSSRTGESPMHEWLKADLEANTKDWTVAFWHHPAYTKGTHDSDTENELIEMRENIVPLLEENGVDLVLTGHSHVYERSHFMDGYYGKSQDWSDKYVKQPGYGREDEKEGAYTKGKLGNQPHQGAVYVVGGNSGQAEGGPLNHPANLVSLNVMGSLVLDFDHGRLDVAELDNHGGIRDYFTLLKGGDAKKPGLNEAAKARLARARSAMPTAGEEAMLFDFEGNSQNAQMAGDGATAILSSAKAFHGQTSLEVSISNTITAKHDAHLVLTEGLAAIPAGAALTFHTWLPSGILNGVEPYVSDSKGGWVGNFAGGFKPNAWNTFSVNVPCDAVLPLKEIGIYLFSDNPGKAKAYIDAVTVTK